MKKSPQVFNPCRISPLHKAETNNVPANTLIVLKYGSLSSFITTYLFLYKIIKNSNVLIPKNTLVAAIDKKEATAKRHILINKYFSRLLANYITNLYLNLYIKSHLWQKFQFKTNLLFISLFYCIVLLEYIRR